MDWKEIAGLVGKSAPLLGTLLGGPAGAAVGGIIASALGASATPDAVSQALTVNPDAAVKLAQIESDERVRLQGMVFAHADTEIAAQRDVVQSVNTTMQSESKSDHWPSYTWRPFNGFVFGTMAFGCYFVLPLMHLTPPSIPSEVWLAFGGILGVASWFRGKAQADPGVPADPKG